MKIANGTEPPLTVGIWYPTNAAAAEQTVGNVTETVAQDAPIAGRGLPLVVISHGGGGWYDSHYDTAIALAHERPAWRVTATDVSTWRLGELGLVYCAENITAKQEDEVGVAVTMATNVFRQTGDGWRMILHHASPAPVEVTQSFNGTLQ